MRQNTVADAAGNTARRFQMLRRVMMVLATAVTLTAALSANAFARGAPVGPLGQIFDGVNPVDHPAIFGGAENAYGYGGFLHARPHKKVNHH
jgi:hypothetical protein